MAKMTLEELRNLRNSQKSEMERRDVEGKDIQVIIGMGTCGIAAGAKDSLNSFIETMKEHNLNNVIIKQTGCMGLCYAEPTVEVRVPGMPDTIYGKVDAAVATTIVETHIINKKLVDNQIIDRPAKDINKQ